MCIRSAALLFAIGIFSSIETGSGDDCYWNEENAENSFGTITPYDERRGDIRDVSDVEDCEPINVWALIRHGTRYPFFKITENMKRSSELKEVIISRYHQGRGNMCAQDITNLQEWQWDDTLETSPEYLTKQGEDELLHLGERFREKFPSLLEKLDSYQFRPTKTERTENSCKYFVQGLSSETDKEYIIEPPLKSDKVIKSYENCTLYNDMIKNNDSFFNHELELYYKSDSYKKVQNKIVKLIGLESIRDLTAETLKGFYDLCRFYRAYSVTKKSPWCALFSGHDIRVLEYADDLRRYLGKSYGIAPYSESFGAQPLKDLYKNLLNSANKSPGTLRTLTAYFSHDSMLEMMYTAMGLFKDYPGLTGHQRIKDRKWRLDRITPFAANFVVVMHKCPSSKPPKDGNDLRVQFLINEKEFPLCGSRTCSWADTQKLLQPFLNVTLDNCKSATH